MGSQKIFNIVDKEDFISMILGLLIVGVVVVVLINYFRSRSGRINLEGLTDVVISDSGKLDESNTSSVGKKYKVVLGDSLWKIAVSHYKDGYKWVDIAKANSIAIDKAGYLEVGRELVIPGVIDENVLPVTHIVVKGESLSVLAFRYYGDMYAWKKIWEVNTSVVSRPELIFPGMSLVIPK